MESSRQQAYDRGHTIFSPDGRLYQVEYAREAVERGSPSVGVRTDEGAVLAARKRLPSPLLEADTVEKIHRVDDHVAVASAGHAADARRLVDLAREVGQRHRLRYGEPIDVESLTTAIADHVQEFTQTGGSRPYGTALLVAGVDESAPASSPRLFELDPSGTPYGWRAVAIGNGADAVRGYFESALGDDGGGTQWGIRRALEGLGTATDEPLVPEKVDVWRMEPEPVTVQSLANDEIAAALAESGVDGGQEN
ncbi:MULTISPECIES: archaeal proteasome endopeptidase complex subunit alpha [Natrialbaceae]|uniref:archaeal proteasome endopeptidase complex subunit alpha n=1 Tax=Natrialbaceae TaxID=1644061 RepID=UPI00207D089E|nr:archaeal proteasome endopeptidase complex subunit alpha [Natronococcus sp. CG52]